MKHGKREMPREHRNHKGLTALVALVLTLCCAVGGTVAWLTTSTNPVKNTFTPSEVGTSITEQVSEKSMDRVTITNTGDIPAYIRAAIVVNWLDKDGNVCAATPEDAQYTLTAPHEDGWLKIGDYYYYTKPVAAGRETSSLLTATEISAPDGYHLQVTILAEAIQADGKSGEQYAVETVWPVKVDPTDKSLSKKN